MSSRREHRDVSIIAGAATALLTTRKNASAYEVVTEMLGGAVGGNFGGWTPDALEPAIHSHHRDVFHSYTTAAVVTVKSRKHVARWKARLRAKADRFAAERAASQNWFDKLLLLLAELACRAAAGFLGGIVPGYLSHLVLDSGTPRGLPLIAAQIV